jgi:hypothetical protein
MKRVSLVLALTLGLAVATLAGLWSSHSASARVFDGLKCYGVRNVVQKGVPNREIYISDQFEAKNLIVKKPINFCTLADKGPAGATAGGFINQDLVCYAIKDAPNQPRFVQEQVLTEDQFDDNVLQLVKPYSLCEPATKQLQSVGTSAGPGVGEFSYKCYRVRRRENGDPFHKISVRLFDQFEGGGKDVRLGRPAVFCTHVEEKKDRAKTDHIENAGTLSPSPSDEVHVSTISATRDRSDPPMDCPDIVDSYGHSVWYTYTAAEDTKRIGLDTDGSTYDTVLGIYTGSPGDLEQVDCDDDSGDGLNSYVSVKVTPYQKYYIVVGAFEGTDAGKLKLHIEITGECLSCAGSGAAAATSAISEESGGAAGVPPLDHAENLVCYSLSQRAPGVELLTGDQLYGNIFDLGRGVMYCTPANKCLFLSKNPAGAVVGPQFQKCSTD